MSAPTPSPHVPAGYQYVWGDEFDGDGIDQQKWAYQGWGQGAIPYEKRQMVDPATDSKHIRVEDSVLHLTSVAEADGTVSGPRALQTTGGRFAFKYGYLEMRANISFTNGKWPALWGRSIAKTTDRREWRYFSELDFLEAVTWLDNDYLGTWNPNVQKWYEPSDGKTNAAWEGSYTPQQALTAGESKWAVYGFLWTPTLLRVSVDGVALKSYDLTRNYDRAGKHTTLLGNRDPHYLILNGYGAGGGAGKAGDMQVDYVRVYQRANEGAIYRTLYEPHAASATLSEDPNEADWLNYTRLWHATREGFTLAGWNTKPDGTGRMLQPGWRHNPPPGTTTLHAIWQPETPTDETSAGETPTADTTD
ncbi:glycoside hydrolase family 16 protein [Bifidobacterium scardovii]|nr:glycoside hydrolase family 16 protein [Bifidobacterium scardovii]MDK6348747.1 glycoside hydrolase family 16 protein [Bifidobacterium scardovii]BAQ31561.1 putative glycoside hydrolase [Bifidobacterium scardovii JCM 12489 = DSM 13734]